MSAVAHAGASGRSAYTLPAAGAFFLGVGFFLSFLGGGFPAWAGNFTSSAISKAGASSSASAIRSRLVMVGVLNYPRDLRLATLRRSVPHARFSEASLTEARSLPR